MKRERNVRWKNWVVNFGMFASLVLLGYCIVYIVNYYSKMHILRWTPTAYKKTGTSIDRISVNEIGDSIGGILNPLIGLLASVLTFMAFYMQKIANSEIQEQFREQQFESQFYEMLHLHKENVNEMEVEFIKGDLIKGRSVFRHMNDLFTSYLKELDTIQNNCITEQGYSYCYQLFFWGAPAFKASNNISIAYSLYPENHDPLYIRLYNTISIIDAPQRGFAVYLGHYFRHLFLMVKFVVESSAIKSYDRKMHYLKILRAQLSNYEQIMLFYNWIAQDYGGAWEANYTNFNERNHFFTEYKMIHNLWVNELYQNPFFVDKVNGLIEKYKKSPKKTPLFEFQGHDLNEKMKLKSK